MTHTECVEIAYRWLLKNGGVGLAFKELRSMDAEIPDVLGFDSSQSILIECKVSRSDFLSDKKKLHRQNGRLGMGNWRFYCCPKGLIKVEDLPEKWGLIYIDNKGRARVEYDCRIKKIKELCTDHWTMERYPEGFYFTTQRAEENRFDVDVVAERRMMYTALRRLFIKGHMKHIYDRQYKFSTDTNDLIELNNGLNTNY